MHAVRGSASYAQGGLLIHLTQAYVLCLSPVFHSAPVSNLSVLSNRTAALTHLPMQKLLKIRPSSSSELKVPVISPSACWACLRSSASNSPAPLATS